MAKKRTIFDEMRDVLTELNFLAGMLSGRGYAPNLRVPPQAALEPMQDNIDAGNEYVITLDMPGVDPRDVKVNSSREGIFIESPRMQSTHMLPSDVDPSKIKLTYKNGVLTIRAPKLS